MMLSNIFVGIEPLLKEKEFNIDITAVIDFLGHYKSNQWLYPGTLHKKLRIDIKIVYEILEICVEEGVLEQYLVIYCPNCQRITEQRFKTIADIPEEVYCSHCDEEIENPLEYAIVVYKVL